MREIGQTDLLTREQEVKLAQKIREGDTPARHLMIKANLRLVVKNRLRLFQLRPPSG